MAKHLNLMTGLYNNYFNRIVKKEPYDFSYFTVMGNTLSIKNINFNPNDGITTKVIIGKGDYLSPESETRPIQPDYAILYSTELDNPPYADAKIISRWFIIEANRTRSGQYELTLRRDVMVDFYDQIVSAPVYLEKGFINDTNNPLLYNSESVQVNQIKKDEFALKDETESGWVVGYVPSDAFTDPDDPSYSKTVDADVAISVNPNITVTDLADWEYWKYCSNNPSFKNLASSTGSKTMSLPFRDHYVTVSGRNATDNIRTERVVVRTRSLDTPTISVVRDGTVALPGSYPAWYSGYTNVLWEGISAHMSASTAAKIFVNIQNSPELAGYINSILGSETDIGDVSVLTALDGQIIYDSNSSQYWKIRTREVSISSPVTVTTDTTAGTNLINFVNNNMQRAPTSGTVIGTVKNNFVSGEINLNIDSPAYYLVLESVGVSVETTLSADRAHLNDAPYDMFCIPYSDTLQLKTTHAGTPFTCSKNVAVSIACEIGRDTGSGNLYDIQLVPYCPNRALILGSDSPLELELQNVKYNIIEDSITHAAISAVIWCTDSTFQVQLEPSADLANVLNPGATAIARKLSNECDLYRLVAQNHSAIFEFSPAKSNGVDGFIADCTYKPWSPYIHIIPKLKGLYGDKFVEIDDARGLIVGGDMSLPQLSNAWSNYTLQNKTYQEMFDRQVKNIDVTNDVNKQQALASAILGTVQGTSSGAMAGFMAGGGWGALAGGVVGAVSSSLAGGIDYTNTLKLMEENRQYAIDMYNFNLQNIQAIPTSLTKTSALTYNTRIWPFVEYYSCTDVERQAIESKITYNGMTIMAISKLSDYIGEEKHYFKGQLIRLDQIEDDSHIVYEIYNELNKGVYL